VINEATADIAQARSALHGTRRLVEDVRVRRCTAKGN